MSAQPLPPVVRRAIDAANAADTQAFLDSFATDGAVDDWGRLFYGPDAIRAWSDREFIGVRVSLTVTGARQSGDTTTVSAQVGGDGFNGPSGFAFTTAGDGITLMRITG
ncbi:nuclear transport factor 2 family protein [Streptomyces prunicolor]|uniref:Nuclear transport factor 2 family protein n=1 Tax=Streptomyces prunicolor TaxID=67348 RepID=A0ABU4F889_9ACTN|nr:nuclear transport factor 2 family protein [Streptomyces prunicolor]MDV7216808.1 nuclear transport factor 2 family protein [Streptomyces prunicolor]